MIRTMFVLLLAGGSPAWAQLEESMHEGDLGGRSNPHIWLSGRTAHLFNAPNVQPSQVPPHQIWQHAHGGPRTLAVVNRGWFGFEKFQTCPLTYDPISDTGSVIQIYVSGTRTNGVVAPIPAPGQPAIILTRKQLTGQGHLTWAHMKLTDTCQPRPGAAPPNEACWQTANRDQVKAGIDKHDQKPSENFDTFWVATGLFGASNLAWQPDRTVYKSANTPLATPASKVAFFSHADINHGDNLEYSFPTPPGFQPGTLRMTRMVVSSPGECPVCDIKLNSCSEFIVCRPDNPGCGSSIRGKCRN